MLKPAIIYKDELIKLFAEQLYTDSYFYYNGYPNANGLPEIKAEDEKYQYAIVDDNKIVGYFSYTAWASTDTVLHFGLYSFDKGNITIGKDVYNKMRELVRTYRRIEWRMIGENPVQRIYDKFCKKYGGNKVVLHDVCKDNQGNYHDEYIYEILSPVKLNDNKTQYFEICPCCGNHYFRLKDDIYCPKCGEDCIDHDNNSWYR